jgi:hypothetical protein
MVRWTPAASTISVRSSSVCRTSELRHSTAAAEDDEVCYALRVAWRHARRYWIQLARRHDRPAPDGLYAEIDSGL